MKLKSLLEYATRSPYSKNYGDWTNVKQEVPKENHPRKGGYFTREMFQKLARDFAEKHGMTLEELEGLTQADFYELVNSNAWSQI